MKTLELNLEDKPVVIGGPGPVAQKGIDFIKAIPNGKFYTGEGIALKLRISRNALLLTPSPVQNRQQLHLL